MLRGGTTNVPLINSNSSASSHTLAMQQNYTKGVRVAEDFFEGATQHSFNQQKLCALNHLSLAKMNTKRLVALNKQHMCIINVA